jgi:hypothetical protein
MEELASHASVCQKRNSRNRNNSVMNATAATVTANCSNGANCDTVLAVAVSDDTAVADSTAYDPNFSKAASVKLLHQDSLQTADATADVSAYDSVEVGVEVKWTGPNRWHSSHNKVQY